MSLSRLTVTSDTPKKESALFCCLFSWCARTKPTHVALTEDEAELGVSVAFRHEWKNAMGDPEDYPSWIKLTELAPLHFKNGTIQELLALLQKEHGFISPRRKSAALRMADHIPKVRLSLSELDIWNAQNLAKVVIDFLKQEKVRLQAATTYSPENIDFYLLELKRALQKDFFLPLLDMLDIAVKQHSSKASRNDIDAQSALDELIRAENLYLDPLLGSPTMLRK